MRFLPWRCRHAALADALTLLVDSAVERRAMVWRGRAYYITDPWQGERVDANTWRFVEMDQDRWVLEHGDGMSVTVLYSNESDRAFLLRALNANP